MTSNRSFLDRAIEYVSPALGARRAYARYAIETAYQAARMLRIGSGSTVSNAGPNAEVLSAASMLRARARDQIRNTGFGKNAKRQWGTRLWSTGMMPVWQSGKIRNARLAQLWAQWSRTCWGNGPSEAGSRWEQAGLHMVNGAFESGEVLALRRKHTNSEKRHLGLTFDLIEPDHLDDSKDGQVFQDGSYVRGGIEFSERGIRRAYYLYDLHPGESELRVHSLRSKRVEASEVVHLFEPDRPGATRGVPHSSAVADQSHNLASYLQYDIQQKKVAACFAAFVTRPDADALPIGTETGKVGEGQRGERIQPAMIHYLANGESVQIAAPAQAGGVEQTSLVMLREIAAGYHIPYEILTGDWSKTNYSSSRSGLIGFADYVNQYRWLVLRPALDGLVWWFLEAAYALGALDVAPEQIKWEWTEPEFRLLDRLNEAQADELELNLGTLTWAQAVAAKGYDPEAQAAEVARWKQAREQAALTNHDAGRVHSEQNGTDKGKADPPTGSDSRSQ